MAIGIAPQSAPVTLRVRRGEPELVGPAEPTPQEVKPLSDIDDQEGLRFQMPGIMFYRALPSMEGRDPVEIVKEALAKALVFYYPFAGRLREGPGRKLVVDCTGEGVVFVGAEADVTLEEFGEEIHPPFPLEELLLEIPGADEMLDTPLLVIQVTRLKCRGFIVAVRGNHTITDGTGKMQFMNAVGEMARGFAAPLVTPLWQRHLLSARAIPRVTCTHQEYDDIISSNGHAHVDVLSSDPLTHRAFLFSPTELAALRRHVPSHMQGKCSTFDVLTTALWRCRTTALRFNSGEEVRLLFAVNARSKLNPPLPKGYYGNACAFPVVVATAEEVSSSSVGHLLDLIRKTKAEVTDEYMRSVADLMVVKGRPPFASERTYVVSDLRHLGFADVDFGWGKPAFGGPANNGSVPDASFYIAFKNKKGESVIMVPVALPAPAMDIFAKELEAMLK